MNVFQQIRLFNEIFGLPANTRPTMLYDTRKEFNDRLVQFKHILLEEISEVDRIVEAKNDTTTALTELADWLGDIIVYAASEMIKFGLDPETIISIIAQSNLSKLDTDGKAIIKDGKVQKGPHYFKPEPEIARWISASMDTVGYTSPNSRQVGGSHYKMGGKPEHWDLAIMYQWDPFQYQVTKYVMRWKTKHNLPEKKLEDLRKAQHFLEKYIDNYRHYLPKQEADKGQDPTPPKEPEGNEFWQNEGYYGDMTCLYACRKCKSLVRASHAPTQPHTCPTPTQNGASEAV